MKAFIFDMDGVIIDSEPIHFEVDAMIMDHLGIDMKPEQLERFVGMTNPEMWRLIKQEYPISKSVEEIMDLQVSEKIKLIRFRDLSPIDGIPELIHALKQHGLKLGLASSSPPRFIEAVLDQFLLRECFDCIVSGEEVPRGKPAPDVFLEAARLLDVRPEDCIVLEDASHGVKAAKAANMFCIGFVNPNSGNQDLSLADRRVHAIRDIHVDELLKTS